MCCLIFLILFQKKEKKRKKDREIITYNIETPKGVKKGKLIFLN